MKEFLKRLVELTKNTTVRVISAILLLCLFASFFLCKQFYIDQWHKIQSFYYVYEGDRAYRKHEPQNAINNYTKALSLHPKHYRARYNLANLYVAYEDFYAALENYQLALELKPDFMVARIDYAIILSEAAFNYDEAIKQYDTAIKNAPKWMYIPFIIDNKKTYKYNKGVAYYNQGLAWRGKSLLFGQDRKKMNSYLKNAVKAYEKALESFKDYDVYYNMGIANQLLGRYYTSGYNYCKAIEKEPMNYEAHYNLAILFKTMRHYEDSAEEFKKAGLLIGKSGDANKTRYIYDVINQVNQTLSLNNPEYLKSVSEKEEQDLISGRITYIGGKMVISEEFDKAMYKNFKNCQNRELFVPEEDFEI